MCFPERNGGLHPDAHFCVGGICIYINNAAFIKFRTKTKNNFYLQPSLCVFQNILHTFSILAAIHLFARSVTKSKISTSPAKKLVAATCYVFNIKHYHKFYLGKSHIHTTSLFAMIIWWETVRSSVFGVRRTGKYVATTKTRNQPFIAN